MCGIYISTVLSLRCNYVHQVSSTRNISWCWFINSTLHPHTQRNMRIHHLTKPNDITVVSCSDCQVLKCVQVQHARTHAHTRTHALTLTSQRGSRSNTFLTFCSNCTGSPRDKSRSPRDESQRGKTIVLDPLVSVEVKLAADEILSH